MIPRLVMAAALLLPSTVGPASVAPAKPPIDHAARAKFPHDSGKEIDALAMLNLLVNSSITYEDDQTHYGINELWVMFPADGKGDCEDYALTKLGLLAEMGFPIVTHAKIVGVIVHHPKDPNKNGSVDDGHALLALRLPSGAVLYMDSNNDEPMTRVELVRQGYRFFDWKA